MDNQVMGNELLDQGKQKALRSGAVFYDEDGLDISLENKGHFSVLIESEKILKAKALIYHELQVNDSLKNHVEKSDIITHPGRRVKPIEGKESVERLIFENGISTMKSPKPGFKLWLRRVIIFRAV